MVDMMESERRELAKRVRSFREKHLMTQKMVAEGAGISLREIKYIEAGSLRNLRPEPSLMTSPCRGCDASHLRRQTDRNSWR